MAEAIIGRLESVAARLEAAASRLGGGGGGDDGESKVAVSVSDYDDFVTAFVVPFVATCRSIGSVAHIGDQAESAFKAQRTLFEAATKCKKPTPEALMKFVDPIVQIVSKSSDPDKRSPVFNHEKAWAETAQLFNWIFLPAPAGVVTATLESSDFYLIKVLTSAKTMTGDEQQNHRNFVKQIKDMVNNFADYVRRHHKAGVDWNFKGGDLASFGGASAPAAASAPAPSSGGAPPPPPPPFDASKKIDFSSASSSDDSADKPAVGGMGAVFGEINSKGLGGVTAGLKKVTKDMKTKNLKEVPALQPKQPAGSAAPVSEKKHEEKKPSSLRLEKGTWFCENYEKVPLVEVPDVQMKQNVYIYNCNQSAVKIPGKVKSIQMDKCVKTQVQFNAVVSTFELVNCKNVQVWVEEQCQSIIIDKCSGIVIHFLEAALREPPSLVFSMSSEINVSMPGATPDSDRTEINLPDQFSATLKNGSWVTEPVHHKA